MCNDVKSQNTYMASKMSEKNSIVFYQDMKYGWGRDKSIECCTRQEKKWDSLVASSSSEIRRIYRRNE
jgi:hypothetical protein